MSETSVFPLSSSDVYGKELVFYDFLSPSNKFSIDLFANSISEKYKKSPYKEDCKVVIGKQCNKYHFFYNGTATLSKKRLSIENIMMDKYHIIRIHGPTHFAVNGSFDKSFTSVVITSDFKTRELILPFIDFDLSSNKAVKKIDSKLRNIQLLS